MACVVEPFLVEVTGDPEASYIPGDPYPGLNTPHPGPCQPHATIPNHEVYLSFRGLTRTAIPKAILWRMTADICWYRLQLWDARWIIGKPSHGVALCQAIGTATA